MHFSESYFFQFLQIAMQQNSTINVVVFDDLFVRRYLSRIEIFDFVDQIADAHYR